jgi:type II secretory pathway pseudopilin PulG
MNLAAKARAGLPRRGSATAGYAMAALLVGLSVMAILLSVAMPTWSHMIRREKEEELVFRGTQYARAINQYQRKFANASPASLDVLIEQRMLRKKFRDPLAPGKDGEFQMLYLGSGSRGMGAGPSAGPGAGPGAGRGAGSLGRSSQAGIGTQSGTGTQTQAGPTYSTTPSGGIVGVTSKNTGTSIRIYKGKTKYNEWQFLGMEQSTQAGPGGGGAGAPQGGLPGRVGGAGSPGGRGGSGGGRGGSGGRGDFGGPGGFPGGSRGSGPSPQR